MEFDTETDPDTLYELFGDDASSFSEGPVWVYVLERRRAVEVWNTLMGPKNPEGARQEMPNCLHALYGISAQQNGVMGSPDVELAEIQIASLFISSPPFPPSDLPPDDGHDVLYDSLDSEQRLVLASDERYTASNGTRPSTVSGRLSTTSSTNLNANGRPLFRARPIPTSALNPDIVPRTTRAAALRAGQAVEKKESGPRDRLTKDQLRQAFLNVPGHKRAETIAVASTAAPTIAPRMTKAASLRMGLQVPAPVPIRRAVTDEERTRETFQGVPGHKRRETISVASTKAPIVAPRLNKSAALRVAHKEAAPPPSSFRGPAVTRSGAQTPSRPASSLASSRPSTARSSSSLGSRPSLAPRSKDDSDTPAKELAQRTPARRRQSSVAALPSIPPRTNKSAELRAAKKEMEAAAASPRNGGQRVPSTRSVASKVPPSSFKSSAVAS
ncbi:hypothetical protein AX15_002651 [Amanita polypyramis BW_CC]|nr:hypothetical protein AX15_002651 [Amanita polypyramis BW_CC]